LNAQDSKGYLVNPLGIFQLVCDFRIADNGMVEEFLVVVPDKLQCLLTNKRPTRYLSGIEYFVLRTLK